jgi:hypothetical protein
MVAGYLVAYWYLLMKVTRPKAWIRDVGVDQRGRRLAGIAAHLPAFAIVFFAAIVNCPSNAGDRAGAYPPTVAPKKYWTGWGGALLVTDGMLDTHLQVMAREQGIELNFALSSERYEPVLSQVEGAIDRSQKTVCPGGNAADEKHVDLGVLPSSKTGSPWIRRSREGRRFSAFRISGTPRA